MPVNMDKITQLVVIGVCFGLAGFIGLLVTVALFGPQLAPLMNKLPW